jgi:hypothetical protein
LTGELVKIQMKKKEPILLREFQNIQKSIPKRYDIWSAARERPMKVRARELAIAQNWK